MHLIIFSVISHSHSLFTFMAVIKECFSHSCNCLINETSLGTGDIKVDRMSEMPMVASSFALAPFWIIVYIKYHLLLLCLYTLTIMSWI